MVVHLNKTIDNLKQFYSDINGVYEMIWEPI